MSKEDDGGGRIVVGMDRVSAGNRRVASYWRLAPTDRIVSADELHNTLVENARLAKIARKRTKR